MTAKPFFEAVIPVELTAKERIQRDIARYNALEGVQTDGIDCPICKNKQIIYTSDESGEYLITRDCQCKKQHESLRLARQSGMNELLKCSFTNFDTTEAWQKKMLSAAKAFADNPHRWFYIAGQSGCGKTHLASAICNELMSRNYLIRRMPWIVDSERLKAARNTPDYQKLMNTFKTCDVLYIDDFFKVQHGTTPTAADVKLAFELLDTRMVEGQITVFTSELFAADVAAIDEAVGGRIMEMTAGGNRLAIDRNRNRNYRLKQK